MRSYWAYKTFYVAAALDDLDTVMSDERPFCIMITHGLKSAKHASTLCFTQKLKEGGDESIEYWEDDIQPMRDCDVRFIAP